MKTDSPITLRPEGGQTSYEGRCINLSAAGVLFMSQQRFTPGTRIDININPQYSVVPPLEATIEVIRTQVHSSGHFVIAGQIKEMH